MMNAPDDFTGPVNLGNPAEFSIRQLAELVVKLSGSKSKVCSDPPVAGGRSDSATARYHVGARARLGWDPKTPLEQGLRRTIEWFKKIDMNSFRAPTPNY
jgi:UDP-glucuronate decarboxylase